MRLLQAGPGPPEGRGPAALLRCCRPGKTVARPCIWRLCSCSCGCSPGRPPGLPATGRCGYPVPCASCIRWVFSGSIKALSVSRVKTACRPGRGSLPPPAEPQPGYIPFPPRPSRSRSRRHIPHGLGPRRSPFHTAAEPAAAGSWPAHPKGNRGPGTKYSPITAPLRP